MKSEPLVPRLRLGTQGAEALPRVHRDAVPRLEAEPLALAFRGRASERVSFGSSFMKANARQHPMSEPIISRDLCNFRDTAPLK